MESMTDQTPEEWEVEIGDQLRALRVNRNIDQKTLAERAGISLRALRNLEGGAGTTLRTLVSVVRALGRQDWLRTVGPVASINPLMLSRTAQPRHPRAISRKGSRLRTPSQRATGSCNARSTCCNSNCRRKRQPDPWANTAPLLPPGEGARRADEGG